MFKTGSLKRKIAIYTFVTFVGLYFIIAGGLLIMSKMAVMEGVDMKSTRGEFKSPHRFKILDHGIYSLKSRIEMIRRAEKSIELEFFIFDLDQTSRALMGELIKKAKEGVNVRILVDFSKPIFRLGPAYAKYLSEFGIEVRYYNTAPLYRLVSIQHRTHRKILVVDDKEAIVGGRNIADEYFDMDPVYNFLDSDVHVVGEVAKFIREGFDAYFDSKITHKPDLNDVPEDTMTETINFMNGDQSGDQGLYMKEARWGVHAKRAVFDKKHTLVGTYNIDPRSANLNGELVIICKDSPELAEATLLSMEERLKVASQIIGEGEIKNMDALYSKAGFKTKVMMILMMPFSSLFQFLL